MPQLQLPLFPAGVNPINNQIAVECQSGRVVYVLGHMPVFQHGEEDLASFRLFTSQLVAQGTIRHGDVVRTFGIPLATVKRYVKLYREQGPKGFFAPRRHRSASVLNKETTARAQALLETGRSVPEVGRELEILPNTLHKAIRAGRLHPAARTPAAKKKTAS